MKKKINFYFLNCFCVAVFSILSCSYQSVEDDGDGTILQTRVGHRPVDIVVGEEYPKYTTDLIDHLYIAECSAGDSVKAAIEGYLSTWNVENCGKFNWYSGSSGMWKEYIPEAEYQEEDNEVAYFKFSVKKGIYFFIVEAVSTDGLSKIYSNPLKIECGTKKTKKIGWIVYKTSSGFDVKEDYNSKHGNPVGIVCDVDDNGNPKLYISLKNSTDQLQLCLDDDAELSKLNLYSKLSIVDGRNNWETICEIVSDEDKTKSGKSFYPAFKYCTELSKAGNGNWYIPSRDEDATIYYNMYAINKGLNKLQGFCDFDLLDKDGDYYTSSQYPNTIGGFWYFDYNEGCYEDISVTSNLLVRPISRF
ncbi:MAG: hypothetical protein KBS84_02530 [Treponema sp.]|nr:hypothetical protein [Candidatus Treponema scatequi]